MSAAAPQPDASAAPVGLPVAMLEKARTVTATVRRLKRDFDGAHRLAHQAEVREALTRTELTLALNESMAARAELAGRVRAQALAAFQARGRPRLRRHNRPSRLLDRILAKLGAPGQALVIARSGVWRGAGGPLRDLRHMAAYAGRRANPGAAPFAPLDQGWYLAEYPDVAQARMAPLVHYLIRGGREGRAPSALFDPEWYAHRNGQVLGATGMTPLEHYVRAGAAEGASPHPLFDVPHYLAQAPVHAPGDDPLSHYLREGWTMGLSPHPVFDPAWYARQAGAIGAVPPLVHYLEQGWKAGLSPHPLFDVGWYLAENPDVAASGREPLAHFLDVGGQEGRSPGPWFDTPTYLAERGEALAPGVNPLLDYLQGGAWSVAEARPGFPTAAYLATRPELVRAGVTPLEHWARRGGR